MILVTGGTGAAGGELLRRLSARGTPVRATVRNAGRYLVEALAELFAERRKGEESTLHPDTAALLGRAATGFDAFAARHAAIFRGKPARPAAEE